MPIQKKGAPGAGAPEAKKEPRTVTRYVAVCKVPYSSSGLTGTHDGRTVFTKCPWNDRPNPILHDSQSKAWREAGVHMRDAAHMAIEERVFTMERSVRLIPVSKEPSA